MIKRYLCICLLSCLALSLFSCNKKEYRDGIACSELMEIGSSAAPSGSGYEPMSTGRLGYAFGETDHDDCAVYVSTATENIDEIGIFHTQSGEKANELSSSIENYLSELLEEKGAFIASYAPTELEKLENSQVRVYGNYVAYAILSRQEQEAFFDAIEDNLKIG